MDREHHDVRPVTPRLIIGASIAVLGVVLTLDRLGLVNANQVLRMWPAVLIIIGLELYLHPRDDRSATRGIVWMALGGWLLLYSIGAVTVHIWDLFWPAVLILIGTNLVMQTVRSATRSAEDQGQRVSMFAVLGGVKRSNAGPFHGGEITALMGGAQLDLRQAVIAPGAEAAIDIFGLMGGIEIIVPPDWTISTPLLPVLGGIEDKRLAPLPGIAQAGAAATPPRLVLRGFVMMGGVTLRG